MEAEEVPEDLDLEGRDSAVPEVGAQDGVAPAEDGAVPFFRDAVSDGAGRAEALRT